MAKARDRMETGCQSESRRAVPEKNRALAVQLDNLFSGRQGVLEFLDNCGSVVSMEKLEEVRRFAPREVFRLPDALWSLANRNVLVQAAKNLYFRLHPGGQLTDDEILGKITEWSFQVLPPADDPNGDEDQTDLSLVETGARASFLAMCEEDQNEEEFDEEDEEDEMGERENGKSDERPEEPICINERCEIVEAQKRRMEIVPPFWLWIPPWMR